MEGKEELKATLKKGFWKPEEDLILKKYVESHGEGNWTVVSKKSGKTRSILAVVCRHSRLQRQTCGELKHPQQNK